MTKDLLIAYLYLITTDKNRSVKWFQVLGELVPLEGSKYGSLKKIAYDKQKFNRWQNALLLNKQGKEILHPNCVWIQNDTRGVYSYLTFTLLAAPKKPLCGVGCAAAGKAGRGFPLLCGRRTDICI